MAQPKRKWSKQRTHTKRSTWKLDNVNPTQCPQCFEAKLPHRVCKACGFYDGKQVIELKNETNNKE